MNETDKSFIFASQHYLFEVSGEIVVGYFRWRESVIVVVFDARDPDCLHPDNIRSSSRVRLMSVEAARRDWADRESNTDTIKWCRVLALENYREIESRLKTICRGLAIGFRDSEEARIGTVAQGEAETFTTVINRILKQMKIENKTSPVLQEYTNYNYPMEA